MVTKPTTSRVTRPTTSAVTGVGVSGGGVSVTYLPSSVTDKAVGVYGVEKLVSDYSGNFGTARRVSDDATMDIPFETDGTIDIDAVLTWAGTVYVALPTINDQLNSNNLAQATTGNQLVLVKDSDGKAAFGVVSAWGGDSGVSVSLSGFAESVTGGFDAANLTLMDVSRWEDQSKDGRSALPSMQVGLSANTDAIRYIAAVRVSTVSPVTAEFIQQVLAITNNFATSGTAKSFRPANTQYAVNHFRSNASGRLISLGEYASSTGSARTTKSITGLRVGRANGTNFGGRWLSRAIIAGQALTEQEATDAKAVLQSRCSAIGAVTRQIAVEGDSISGAYLTAGFDSRTFSWARHISDELGPTVLVRNLAQSGGHIEGAGDGGTKALEFGPQAPDKVDPLLDGTTFSNGQLLIVFAGTNDIGLLTGSDGDAETVHARLETYCSARQTAGWSVLVVGPIPRGPFDGTGKDTELEAYDDLIFNNWSNYADAYVNLWDEGFAPGGDYSTYYQSDEIHPNAAGHAKIAAAVLGSVQSLLGLANP